MIYLDSAATTLQKPPAVSSAVSYAIRNFSSPGRGGYPSAMAAADTVFTCREEAAALFGADSPEQVVFTGSATHGLNIAIRSLVKPGDTVLISGYEHNAVTRPLYAIEGVTVKIASSVPFDTRMMFDEFSRQMTEDVSAVIMTHVSNVFGFVLPLEEIAALCRRRKKPLIVDASQSAGCLPLSLKGLGAAFLAMPGHKGLYGPQGTGLLLCGQPGRPLLYGGTGSQSLYQEMPDFLPDRLEAGTHNVCGIAGLLVGLRFIRDTGEENILRHEQRLTGLLADGITHIRGTEVFHGEKQTGVLSFRIKGIDCEELGELLAHHGIAVRAGLHCAPAAHRSAGTLETGTVRVSVSAFSREEEMLYFLKKLEQLTT